MLPAAPLLVVPAAAERRLSRDVHRRRRADDRQDGRGHPRDSGRPRGAGTERVPLRPRRRARGRLRRVGAPGRPRLPARRSSGRSAARCTIASPTRASSKRDSPRRLRRHRRLLRLFPDCARAPSARRRASSSTCSSGGRVRRSSKSALIVADVRGRRRGRRRTPSATSAASIPARSSSTKCSACSITLAFIPVGWSGALAGFRPVPRLRRDQAVSGRTGSSSCTAASASWPTMRWRRSTRTSPAPRDVAAAGVDSLTADGPLAPPKSSRSAASCSGRRALDTNSLFIAERLAALGIELRDQERRRRRARRPRGACSRQALDRADLVVLTGGLGPTDDDLTRDVVAEVLGLPLDRGSGDRRRRSAQRFARRGMTMPEVNRRQAMVPRGAIVLDNPNGTAPGLLDRARPGGRRDRVLLPGPPRELKPMFDALSRRAAARARRAASASYRTSLFITGRGESHVEQASSRSTRAGATATPPIATTILAALGQIELHLTRAATPTSRADARRSRARATELLAALGDDVYSTDGRSMEEVVGDLLDGARLTIAAAESCTGGLLMSRLTDVPGSSAYVRAGVVATATRRRRSCSACPPRR